MSNHAFYMLFVWLLGAAFPLTNVFSQSTQVRSFQEDLYAYIRQLNHDLDDREEQSMMHDLRGLEEEVEDALEASENSTARESLSQFLEDVEATEDLIRALFDEGSHVSLRAIDLVQQYVMINRVTLSQDSSCMPVERWEIGHEPYNLFVTVNSDRHDVIRYKLQYTIGASTVDLEAGVGPQEAGVVHQMEERKGAETFRIRSFLCTSRIEMYPR